MLDNAANEGLAYVSDGGTLAHHRGFRRTNPATGVALMTGGTTDYPADPGTTTLWGMGASRDFLPPYWSLVDHDGTNVMRMIVADSKPGTPISLIYIGSKTNFPYPDSVAISLSMSTSAGGTNIHYASWANLLIETGKLWSVP
jgi:hypothetical protein